MKKGDSHSSFSFYRAQREVREALMVVERVAILERVAGFHFHLYSRRLDGHLYPRQVDGHLLDRRLSFVNAYFFRLNIHFVVLLRLCRFLRQHHLRPRRL
jgi:hypothetical protein